MPPRYVKITARFGDRRRTVILRVSRETHAAIYGMVVGRDGDPVEVETTTHLRREMVVAARRDIERCVPMRMNLHYAELEPVPGQACDP